MIHYEQIDFSSSGESYKYRLLEKVIFVSTHNLGKWELYTPENDKVATCNGKIITVFPGYMWDGLTVIGAIYEDEITLKASILHDVLYNAKKNPDDIDIDFTLFRADLIFRSYLCDLYGKSGGFIQKYIFPNLYLFGLWTLGLPWKFGNNGYYKLKKGA